MDNNIRQTVANHWATKYDRKRSITTDTAEGENKREKPAMSNEIEVIEINDDDDDVQEVPQPTEPKRKCFDPPLLPLHNEAYDIPKLNNSKTFKDLIGSPDLKACYLFSFQFELDFILPQFSSNSTEINILHQNGRVIPSNLVRSFSNLNFYEIYVPPFSAYHPKLIINQFKNNTFQIHIMSPNLTEYEFCKTNNQMVWSSPLLSKNSNSKTQFKTNLLIFLQNHDISKLKSLVRSLTSIDFSEIKNEFHHASTGLHSGSGYLGLYDLLAKNNLITKSDDKTTKHILYQSSSIASALAFNKKTQDCSNVFTHILAPLVSGVFTNQSNNSLNLKSIPLSIGLNSVDSFLSSKTSKLYIIFPTTEEIRTSKPGYVSGTWSVFNTSKESGKFMFKNLLSKFFYKSFTKQRSSNPSHTKFFLMSSDNFKTLDWCLFTTANLSKQAWGHLRLEEKKSNTEKVSISNYECSVLIHPKQYGENAVLKPLEIGSGYSHLESNEVPVFLPFKLPPEKYSNTDTPWDATVSHSKLDSNGQPYSTMF